MCYLGALFKLLSDSGQYFGLLLVRFVRFKVQLETINLSNCCSHYKWFISMWGKDSLEALFAIFHP
jgi:hypothetical protein